MSYQPLVGSYGGVGSGAIPQLNFGSLNGAAGSSAVPMASAATGSVGMPLAGYNPGAAHATHKLAGPQSARLNDASKPTTPARPPAGYSTARGPQATGSTANTAAASSSSYGYTPYTLHHYTTQGQSTAAAPSGTGVATGAPLPPATNATLRHQSRGGGVRPLFYAPTSGAGTTGAATGSSAHPQVPGAQPHPPPPSSYATTNGTHGTGHHPYDYGPASARLSVGGVSVATTATAAAGAAVVGSGTSRPSIISTSGSANNPPGTSGGVGSSSSSSAANERKAPNPPMTPAAALTKYGERLTPFEQSEILEHAHVYFVGQNCTQKVRGIPHTANNNGYDDERGDYRLVMHDQLEYRYEVLSVLGRGSFGQVVRVLDHKNQMVLALKMIRNKKRFHHQALVEVKILEHVMRNDREHKSNIVRMYGYFYFRNHLCITFEPLSINLYEFIKNNGFKGVSLALIRRFAIQLLVSLKFLRRERIVHCDLKPENVLLKAPNKATIKLIDFGSSCFEDERVYTYIQSRFYRSPEVILGLPYDLGIDMWSFGCILAEMFTGYPLFPGENETEQIQCIMEVLGPPPKRLIAAATRKKTFFDSNDKPRLVPNSRGKVRRPSGKDLQTATKCNDPNFISFLKKCLKWDPKTRLTPEKALEHPFITEVTFSLAPSLPYKQHADGQTSVVQSSGGTGSNANGSSALTSGTSGGGGVGASSSNATGSGAISAQFHPHPPSYPPGGSASKHHHSHAVGGSSNAASATQQQHYNPLSSNTAATTTSGSTSNAYPYYSGATGTGVNAIAAGGTGTTSPAAGSSAYDDYTRKKKRMSSEMPALAITGSSATAIAGGSKFPSVALGTGANAAAGSGSGSSLPALSGTASASADKRHSGNNGALGLPATASTSTTGAAPMPYAYSSQPHALPTAGAAVLSGHSKPLAYAAIDSTGGAGTNDEPEDEYDDDDVANAAAHVAGHAGGGGTGLHAGPNSNSSLSLLLQEKSARDKQKKRSAEQISKLIARETGEPIHAV